MDSQPLKFDAFHQLALQPHNDNLTAAGRDPVVWDAGGVTAQAAACHHAESAVFVAAQTLMIHRNTLSGLTIIPIGILSTHGEVSVLARIPGR